TARFGHLASACSPMAPCPPRPNSSSRWPPRMSHNAPIAFAATRSSPFNRERPSRKSWKRSGLPRRCEPVQRTHIRLLPSTPCTNGKPRQVHDESGRVSQNLVGLELLLAAAVHAGAITTTVRVDGR